MLFRPFFKTTQHFWECVKYGLKPDFISWLDKDLQRDYGKSMRLGFYITFVFVAAFVAFGIVEDIQAGRQTNKSQPNKPEMATPRKPSDQF